MHFGASVRHVLSESCGTDLTTAPARTPLPDVSAGMLEGLAARLEERFGVRIPDPDLAHLRTIRDVLRCVRLRRWEQRIGASVEAVDAPCAADAAAHAGTVSAPGVRGLRARLRAWHAPTPVAAAAARARGKAL